MDSLREIRYYASIPKIMLLLLCMTGFTFASWQWLVMGHNVVASWMSWIVLVLCGLGMLIALVWLLLTVIVRRPILRITNAGFTSSPPIKPWRSRFVPWDDVERIGISVQRLSARTTSYYFVIEARHPERYTSSNKQRLAASMYPSLTSVAITVMLNWLFLRVSRGRRAQLLERVRTTFAPEIAQHNVWVDEKERPM